MEAIFTPGDIWQCLKAFLVVTAGKGGTTVVQRAAAGILRNILQCIGQSLTTKNYQAPNISCTEAEKA